MTAYRAVVFDYDGTLFDTRPAIIHCLARAFDVRRRPVPAREAVARTVTTGLSLHDSLIMLDDALRHDPVALGAMVETYRELYAGEGERLTKPFAGAAPALAALHADGVICIVVSNKGIAAVRRSLEDNAIAGFVDLLFADEPGLPKKPDPAILTGHILPRYAALRRDEFLIVGDTETDIQFARASDTHCCFASYGYGDKERCRSLAPDYEIAGLDELPALVCSG